MASSLENNKILAAVLTAGIIASGAGVTSRILYHPEVPEEPAYVIEVAEDSTGGDGDAGGEEAMTIAALLPNADIANGESGAKKCVSCHSFEEGGENKIGPNLYGIVGRDIASVSGFAYSDALNGIEGDWSYEALDAFIASPKDYAPGTKMAYAGMRSGEDRADLILYMRSLAADPLPLPEAEAVETGAAEEAEGGEGDAEAAAEGDAAEGETAEEDAAGGAAEETVADEAADAADGAAEPAVEAADAVAEEAESAAGEVAETAGEVVEGAEETATEAAEAVTDEADAAAEAAADAAESAAEGAAEEAEGAAASVSDAAEETIAAAGDAASEAAADVENAAGAAASGLIAMIAEGDVAKGERVAKKCKACHVFEEGGQNKLGPALWGIVDKDIASHEGFNYSSALSELEGAWTYDELDQFLAAPKDYVPGTKMVFAGLKKEQDRADLIAYLRTLDAEPAPLN